MNIDTGNLRISWKSYNSPKFFYYKEYYIKHDHGYDCFLFIGPLHFRWWVEVVSK